MCRMISVPSDYTSASVSGSHPIIKGEYLWSRKQRLEAFRSLADLLNAAHRLLFPFKKTKQMDNSDGPNGPFPNYRLGWLSVLLQKTLQAFNSR